MMRHFAANALTLLILGLVLVFGVVSWTKGQYQGRGPLELGVWWSAYRDDKTAISLYAGHADPGDGRNAGYAAPGQGGGDWEVRGAIGRNLKGQGGRWAPDSSFVELQAGRRMRAGLPDETRVDLTLATPGGGIMPLSRLR